MNRINPFSKMNYINADDSHFDPSFFDNTVPEFKLQGGRKTPKKRSRKRRSRKLRYKCPRIQIISFMKAR